MKRWLFFIVWVLSLVVTTNPTYSMSGNVHVADMNEVFENLSSSNPGVKDLYKNLTSHIIDDSTKDRFLKSLPVAPDGSKLDHRSLFHWGFSGDIPFNTDGNLKRYLEKFPPGERDRIKKLIALEWQARVNHITDEAVKILGWPSPLSRLNKWINISQLYSGVLRFKLPADSFLFTVSSPFPLLSQISQVFNFGDSTLQALSGQNTEFAFCYV